MIDLINGDCLEKMLDIPDGSVDLTLTSPPYDNLRTYNNQTPFTEFIWKGIINQLYRVTKKGGVVVWVVGDATIDGSESGSSFKQALYFKECGFNIHDTMIYLKPHVTFPETNRYYNAFEYMFVFSKGKPKTFNPIKDRENKTAGGKVNGSGRQKDGSIKKQSCRGNIIKSHGFRFNYWLISNSIRGSHNLHPATFSKDLALDHVKSWTNKDDVVLDPMMGSGTTGEACLNLNRNFIGIEKDETYFEYAKDRLEKVLNPEQLVMEF